MSISTPARLAIPLLAAAILAGGGAASGMEAAHAPSTVTLKSPAPNTFKGRVSSAKGTCVPHRTVNLYQRRLGGEIALISQGVGDKRGIWRIGLEGPLTGKFFAKVKFRRVASLLCKGARSTAIHITA
jgi:hypothetical protein